jgi:glucose-1-phosphate adenylyltransferase
MLDAGEKMFAYRFEGYWKDVGTIDSLWESNMDLLNPKVELDLGDEKWRIYARNPVMPPHYIAKDAKVQNSMIAEGCNVYGDLEFSILFSGVYVAKGAEVTDSIIMPGAVIEEGAKVQYAIVSENAVIGKNAVIGEKPENMEKLEEWGVAVVGPGCKIGAGDVVPPKTMVDAEEGVK